MYELPRTKLEGEVISVAYAANRCQITIDLKGTPAVTAALMKQSLVTFGVVSVHNQQQGAA